jgi:8-oxo-dGTP pyrophosphatase MutT (NUDIX family)
MKMNNILTEEHITQQLIKSYRPGKVDSTDFNPEMDADEALKCAAVLLPLIWWQDEWQLVFTRRTDTVEHHKGQVSFPGGGCDLGESSPEETALREAWEEIGLLPEDVRLLGRMNDVITITRYRITPVVGVMPWPYEVRLEKAEVARVFTIPLRWLADQQNWSERPFTLNGITFSTPVIRYNLYDGENLWGISARIIQNFLTVLGLKD